MVVVEGERWGGGVEGVDEEEGWRCHYRLSHTRRVRRQAGRPGISPRSADSALAPVPPVSKQ